MLRKILLVVSLLFSALLLQSCGTTVPKGCAYCYNGYSGGQLVLRSSWSAPQTLYLMKNNSKITLSLDHPKRNLGASAGWLSKLSPGRWSAFVVGPSNTTLSCATRSGQPVPCKEVLRVMRTAATFKHPSPGAYWAVENRRFNSLIRALKRRGIERETGEAS